MYSQFHSICLSQEMGANSIKRSFNGRMLKQFAWCQSLLVMHAIPIIVLMCR